MINRVFVDDIIVQGMYYAVFIRSPVAAGLLESIEVPKLPPAYTLIRAEDIPGQNSIDGSKNPLRILAFKKLEYIGEPVAMLVGPDLAQLEYFASRSKVLYRETPPNFLFEKFSSDNLAAKRMMVQGDPDRVFKKAPVVIEAVYKTDTQEHWYPEPHGALAQFTYDKMSIHVGTQWPYHVQHTVSSVLKVNAQDILIHPTETGVHLDGKLWFPSVIAAQTALAAFICKKPVKLLLTRTEDFMFSPKRAASSIKLKTALNKKGELQAIDVKAALDMGAGSPFAEEMLDRISLGALGIYSCPNIRLEAYAVKTNKLPSNPFAGMGLSQGNFAMENHVQRISQTLQMDPAEWKRSHIFRSDDSLPIGTAIKDRVPSEELLDTLEAMSDYKRKRASYELLRNGRTKDLSISNALLSGPLRGIGLSMGYQGGGFLSYGADTGKYSVELTLEKDGNLEIRTSAVCSGGETQEIWKRLAADILSMDSELVHIAENRTDLVPDSGPSSLSRNITVVTKLIERACTAIRKQRFRDPLPITVKRSYRSQKAGTWDSEKQEGGPFTQLSWAAAAVELEIDPIDFAPLIKGVWLVVDGGRILYEAKARSALRLSSLQALSWASRERLSYTEGAIQADAALHYDIPVLRDMPPVKIEFTWLESGGPKGIGELPFSCIPSAYSQALSQAANIHFNSLPVGAREIQNAMKNNGETR